jgi:hypothetical protein
LGSNWRPATPSSNRSPLERGTEISDAETNRQTGPFAKQRPLAETHAGAKSPHSGAVNAKRLTKVSTQGLGGGDSRARTGDPPPSLRTDLRLTPGTGFQTAETEAKMPSICRRRLRTETRRDTKSPYSGATMRQGRTEFEPWRLLGGRTRARTWDPMIKSPNDHQFYQWHMCKPGR